MAWFKSNKVEIANILKGTSNPSSSIGDNGQLYLKYANLSLREYIEVGSTAGPYINTGFYWSSDCEFEIKAKWTGTPANNTAFFGAYSPNQDTDVQVYNGNTLFYVGGGGTASLSIDTNDHIYKATQSELLLDGTSVATPNWSRVPASLEVSIFTMQQHSPAINARIYYIKIWKSGELHKYFIPAINNETNEIGMFEAVSGEFYSNDGTGNFDISSSVISDMPSRPILSSFAKVDDLWQSLIGTDVDDIQNTSQYQEYDEGYFVETVSKTSGSASIKIIKQSADGTKEETVYTQSDASSEINIDGIFKFQYSSGWNFTLLQTIDGFRQGDTVSWGYDADADFFVITKYSWTANYEWLYNSYGGSKPTVTLTGRAYFKVYPHQTLIGYAFRGSYTNPLYVSTYKKACVFNTSAGGGPFTNPTEFEYKGKTWYVNTADYAMSGDVTDSDAIAIKVSVQGAMVNAAKYLIDNSGLRWMKDISENLPDTSNLLFKDGEFYNTDKVELGIENGVVSDGTILFTTSSAVGGIYFNSSTLDGKFAIVIHYENDNQSVQVRMQYGTSKVGTSVINVINSGTDRYTYASKSVNKGVNDLVTVLKETDGDDTIGAFFGNQSANATWKIYEIYLILY